MIEKVLLPRCLAETFMEMVLLNLSNWPIKTAASFRNTVLGDAGVFTINPLLGIDKKEDINFIQRSIQNAVAEGRMIDFGFIPNAIIKQESIRSRDMLEANELMHPYDSWIGITAWEGGMNGYYISPNPIHPNETLVVEIYGISIPNVADVIIVYDIISIEIRGSHDTVVHPMPMVIEQNDAELRMRGANSLDPLATMLRLLADASVPITDVKAPVKLNKQRTKQGKFMIPDHTVVHTKDYVVNWSTRPTSRGTDKGGHHASPIAHWRRAHKRTLASGRSVPVRSSKVNWRETEELHRLFYRVPTKEKGE